MEPQTINTQTEHNSEQDWSKYYEAVKGKPPAKTLMIALDKFEEGDSLDLPRFAIDLGCGSGRDTIELLKRGWQVLAIDSEESAISYLRNRSDISLLNLKTEVIAFEEMSLPSSSNLINSSLSLPFCSPENFIVAWNKITESLHKNGRFCGHLFGNKDSWSACEEMTFHTIDEVYGLLIDFEVEYFDEQFFVGETALEGQKKWHIFNIVARKA